jgi:SulP family sulfate permease
MAVLLFSRAVSLVAMPAMAGLLIVAGFQSIKSERIRDIWATGWAPRIVMAVTLGLTLVIPLQQAVFLGVVLSILVHFFVTSSHEVRMALLTLNADGTVTEGAAPAELPGNTVTLLEVFGDMAVAGAETLEAKLPAVKTSGARGGHSAACAHRTASAAASSPWWNATHSNSRRAAAS